MRPATLQNNASPLTAPEITALTPTLSLCPPVSLSLCVSILRCLPSRSAQAHPFKTINELYRMFPVPVKALFGSRSDLSLGQELALQVYTQQLFTDKGDLNNLRIGLNPTPMTKEERDKVIKDFYTTKPADYEEFIEVDPCTLRDGRTRASA